MSMETKKPADDMRASQEAGYEKRDANLPALLWFGFCLAIVIAVAVWGMTFTLNYFQRVQPLGPKVSPLASERTLPPAPRLQTAPHQELIDFCTAQQKDLTSYRWVDQQNGIVQIPVDRAMELVLERGLPIRAASQAPADAGEIHAVGTMEAPLPAGVEGPCGYITEPDPNAKPAEPKD